MVCRKVRFDSFGPRGASSQSEISIWRTLYGLLRNMYLTIRYDLISVLLIGNIVLSNEAGATHMLFNIRKVLTGVFHQWFMKRLPVFLIFRYSLRICEVWAVIGTTQIHLLLFGLILKSHSQRMRVVIIFRDTKMFHLWHYFRFIRLQTGPPYALNFGCWTELLGRPRDIVVKPRVIQIGVVYRPIYILIFYRRLDPYIWLRYQIALRLLEFIINGTFLELLVSLVFVLVVISICGLHRLQRLIVLELFVNQNLRRITPRLIWLAVLVFLTFGALRFSLPTFNAVMFTAQAGTQSFFYDLISEATIAFRRVNYYIFTLLRFRNDHIIFSIFLFFCRRLYLVYLCYSTQTTAITRLNHIVNFLFLDIIIYRLNILNLHVFDRFLLPLTRLFPLFTWCR